MSAAEVVMTQLHSGRRLDGLGGYFGGLNGVGVSVVNALSLWLELRVWRDGKEHFVRFRQGDAEAPLAIMGPAPEGKRGTEITFKPDPGVFRNVTNFDFATLVRWLYRSALANPGLRIVLCDRTGSSPKTVEFHNEGRPRL